MADIIAAAMEDCRMSMMESSKPIQVEEGIGCFTCGRQCILHKDEDGLFRTELDPLPNDINELPGSQVCRNQVPTLS